MITYMQNYVKGILASLSLMLVFCAGPASAAIVDVYLRAEALSLNVAGTTIPAWGFAQDSAFGAANGTLSVPGPVIRALVGDTVNIHLDNNLGEPTSIHIIGQVLANNTGPVWTEGTSTTVSTTGARPAMDYTSRVRSFSHETAAGNTAETVYQFSPLKAGTYCYQSSTNPAKQVQMGLFGVLIVDTAPGQAYPGVTYTKEVLVVLHEIDPDIQAAIDAGTYGAVPGATITSSVFRHAHYYLINGYTYPYPALDQINSAPIGIGDQVLLRFVNAGLDTYAPQTPTVYMSLVGEDGNPYQYARDSYGIELPAAKTMEAIIQPTVEGRIPLYDGRLYLSNGGTATLGGMFAYVVVGAIGANTPPVAVDDPGITTAYEAPVVIPVLANDTDAEADPLTVRYVTQGTNGSVVINPDNTVTYTPDVGWSGVDTFTYAANDGMADSNAATVTVTTGPNTPPVANDDPAILTDFEIPVIIDVLANDTDAELDPLTVSSVTQGTNGSVVINLDNTVTYTPNAGWSGVDTFTYTANDGLADSNVATVTVTTSPPNVPPVARGDSVTTAVNTQVLINVLANDSDSDGVLIPATLIITTAPRNGTAVVQAGQVLYTPDLGYAGSDGFQYTVEDNDGAVSNLGRVKIRVR